MIFPKLLTSICFSRLPHDYHWTCAQLWSQSVSWGVWWNEKKIRWMSYERLIGKNYSYFLIHQAIARWTCLYILKADTVSRKFSPLTQDHRMIMSTSYQNKLSFFFQLNWLGLNAQKSISKRWWSSIVLYLKAKFSLSKWFTIKPLSILSLSECFVQNRSISWTWASLESFSTVFWEAIFFQKLFEKYRSKTIWEERKHSGNLFYTQEF